jgi:cell division septation protein DedD/nucleoid DNA-binding protein
MTKAELIRKVAKNVGVPDTDAKIFFELFLKRISSVVEIGQSIFVKDFGYFHLIKGSIKKPVFSFKDNEVSEEAVELILYSEAKDLRKSDTKGIVFNIPTFDEEDYHPIDSAFSLSIGKPLIPLRGVPFDNIYIPTSGYEYRRLIESKVEKIITASQIAESVENFPTLVIDARSYNSNQVQLLWDDKDDTETKAVSVVDHEYGLSAKTELSDYEKQSKELKNIAWDFGEGLSKQIEAESILDIADERINMDAASKPSDKIEVVEKTELEIKLEHSEAEQENLIPEKDQTDNDEFVEDSDLDESSEKLNELLDIENEPNPALKDEILESSILEKFDEQIDEIIKESITEKTIEEIKPDINNNLSLNEEKSDEEFWKSSSKYFEPYNPGLEKDEEEIDDQINEFENFNNSNANYLDDNSANENSTELIDDNLLNDVIEEEKNNFELSKENQKITMDQNNTGDHINDEIEPEPSSEQPAEYFEPSKKKNLVPFIVFPLLVIVLSLALYWYLEFYKKGDVPKKTKQIVLNSGNSNIIRRDFSIPVSYPYLPKVNETTIAETVSPKTIEPYIEKTETIDKKVEEKKPEVNTVKKENVKPPIVETQKQVNGTPLTGNGLNVGNNIFKYGNSYVVQVASFRASSISENEAGKYRNKGYNAFVEVAEIANRGKWYRVRVGNFTSKEDAQNFIDKNIR